MAAQPRPPFTADVEVPNGDETALVRLHGEIDLTSEPLMTAALDHVLSDRPTRVVVDLADVSFCCLRGLYALAAVRRQGAAQGTAVALARPRAILARVLAVTGLDAQLPVRSTAEPALAHG